MFTFVTICPFEGVNDRHCAVIVLIVLKLSIS